MTHPLIRNLEQRDVLSAEEQEALLSNLRPPREVRARETFIREGERPSESTLLLDGFVARTKVQRDGSRQITALHVPGDFVDLHSFVLKTMDHSVLAITRVRLATMPHEALRRITQEHPHLARLLWLSTVIDGAVHREWLTEMGGQDAYRRTAHFFCELFVRLRVVGLTTGQEFHFPLTQADVSDVLGMSPVHMNRTLMKLRAEKLISWKPPSFTIHDWTRLQEVAEFDPIYLHLDSEPR